MGSFLAEIFVGVVIEFLFHTCCGWLGHWVVRIITLGKVQLEYGEETTPPIAEVIGVICLIPLAFLAWALV